MDGHVSKGDKSGGKSKAELRAERRAIQEAQRAAKASKNVQKAPVNKTTNATTLPVDGGNEKRRNTEANQAKRTDIGTTAITTTPVNVQHAPKTPIRVPDKLQADLPEVEKKLAKKLASQQVPQRPPAKKKVELFGHLPQYERDFSITQGSSLASGVHPAVLRLGLQYAQGSVCGSNARCVALVHALKQVIADYTTPQQKELSRDLECRLRPNIMFLQQCRPISVSMGNVVKYLKLRITNISRDCQEAQAKEELIGALDKYVEENVEKACEAICINAQDKIFDGDIILTYSCSSLVKSVLIHAFKIGRKFRVVVVDSRPKLEGKNMFHSLVNHGIKCSYVLINAVSYVMQEVTKVMLGAHALLANGYVMSRVGSSQVALVAKSYNKPILLCCETYKFCERVQTDSFVFNELGDPDDLAQTDSKNVPLRDWRDLTHLTLLNLMYDVTPPDFISVVITEAGMIPCTSVPVVLRVKQPEQ